MPTRTGEDRVAARRMPGRRSSPCSRGRGPGEMDGRVGQAAPKKAVSSAATSRWLVLHQEVRGIDAASGHAGRPRTPHREHIAVEDGEGASRAPQAQHRARDLAAPIGLVELAVDRRARAVVLTDGVYRGHVVQLAAVDGHDLVGVDVRIGAKADMSRW